MITRAQLVDVLRDHGRRRGIRNTKTHCMCGWVSTAPNGIAQHLQHLADEVLKVLSAADGRGA